MISSLYWLIKGKISGDLKSQAKWMAWAYNTFGDGKSGKGVGRFSQNVYEIIDSGEIQEKLEIHDPELLAGLASVVAEMEAHRTVAMLTPILLGTSKEETRDFVRKQEDEAIERWVNYTVNPKNARETLQQKILYDNNLTDKPAIRLFSIPWYWQPTKQDVQEVLLEYLRKQKEQYRIKLDRLVQINAKKAQQHEINLIKVNLDVYKEEINKRIKSL